MNRRTSLILALGLPLLGAACWLGTTAYLNHTPADTSPQNPDAAGLSTLGKDPQGHPMITLSSAACAQLGLQYAPLHTAQWQPEFQAIGHWEINPASRQILRSPIVGTLRSAAWPTIGTPFAADQIFGTLEPRRSPTESADLALKQNDARAALAQAIAIGESAKAQLNTAQLDLKRNQQLYDQKQLISAHTLEQSQAAVALAQAQVIEANSRKQSARQTLATLTALAAGTPIPLSFPHAGIVLDTAFRPDMPVEIGQELLVAADPKQAQARVNLPVGQMARGPLKAQLFLPGQNTPLSCNPPHLIYDALGTSGQTFLITPQKLPDTLSPGMMITARLWDPTQTLTGVRIPTEAVVRTEGHAFIYVKTDETPTQTRLLRLQVPTDRPLGSDWFAVQNIGDIKPGDQVVVIGAASLLSEERKNTIPMED